MPILPPDKRVFGDDSAGRGSRNRKRVGGRGGHQEADTSQVICTTCVEYFPNNETLMTSRGPTCEACLADMQDQTPTNKGAALWVGLGAGVVIVLGLIAALLLVTLV